MTLIRHATDQAKEEDASLRIGDATVRIDRSSLHIVVTVTGRVTVDSSPRLRSVLIGLIRQNAGRDLVVELSAVSHLDTSGFAILLEALHSAHRHSAGLRLAGINGQPRRLAELAQLDQICSALGSEVVFS